MKTTIFIADAGKPFRVGIKHLLQEHAPIQIIGETDNGADALKDIQQLKPHVALLDVALPFINGFELLTMLHRNGSNVRCLMLTSTANDTDIRKAFGMHAAGILCKNTNETELTTALNHAIQNRFYVGNHFNKSALYNIGTTSFASNLLYPSIPFDGRELSILQMIANEYKSCEIAEELHLSSRTIEGIRSKMLEKVRARTPIGLVLFGVKNGLVKPDQVNLVIK